MAEIFKFHKQPEQEEACCLRCVLHETFFNAIIDSDSEDEVHELIGELIEAVDRVSQKQAIVEDIANKMELLNQLDKASCPCDTCDEENCDRK